MTTTSGYWQLDGIDEALAADFDGSLSGLGIELGMNSFDMSSTLLALPNLTQSRQKVAVAREVVEPAPDPHGDENNREVTAVQAQSLYSRRKNREPVDRKSLTTDQVHNLSTHQKRTSDTTSVAKRRHSSSDSLVVTPLTVNPTVQVNAPFDMVMHMLQVAPPDVPVPLSNIDHSLNRSPFQYILAASTSVTTKLHEETMTYLNQGQPYAVKFRKVRDSPEVKGTMLRSFIKTGFQERRLQYMENEHITEWIKQRPGERILEADVPLSYGACDIKNCSSRINCCEILWESTKEPSVFIRLNCVSTEFTPKKRGGEKGVPFRIMIETYSCDDGSQRLVHAATCQVKVFKPKGADRKHKTDKEKLFKKGSSEKEKYQPSYDCTIFTECSVDQISAPVLSSSYSFTSHTASTNTLSYSSASPCSQSSTSESTVSTHQRSQSASPLSPGSSSSETLSPLNVSLLPTLNKGTSLSSTSTSTDTVQWLNRNRFSSFATTFSSFSGSDILRLTRDDLIEICGLAEGIRLYNTLHSKSVLPKLTIYVCIIPEKVFHAVYLENLRVSDLLKKLSSLCSMPSYSVHELYVSGPSGIQIIVTDEVVRNLHESAMYNLEIYKVHNGDVYNILLKAFDEKFYSSGH